MKNSLLVVTVVFVLAVSGFVFSKMTGLGGGHCSMHQAHEAK